MQVIKNKFYSNKALHNMLTSSINSGHLCHAYLFYGNKGIGKKTLAKYLAMGVLCKGENKPCYNCSSCKKFVSDNHPDLYILESKNAKNSIHIDTIREIRQDAYIKPNESDYKVYIIPNAENMSIGAFNALLKVLEEPPATAMFILTASSKSVLPQTILSRCIPYAVYPLSLDECIEALNELEPDKDEIEIRNAAEQSNGILGKALDILNNENYNEIQNIKNDVLNGIININEYDILKALVKVKNDRQMMNDVIEELLVAIRNAVMHKLNTVKISNEIQKSFAFKITLSQCEQLVLLMQKAVERIESNVNLGILTNWLCASIITIIA